MKNGDLTKNGSATLFFALIAVILTFGFTSCNCKVNDDEGDDGLQASGVTISEQEVLDAQKVWGDAIVKIGQTYLDNGDYKTVAFNHIDELYGYDLGPVLFKPTLASQKQFRNDEEGALSYFVGGNPDYPEDHGFAIKPWSAVRWENNGIKTEGNMAVAMGNYYFTPVEGGDDVKVEYSFAYTKDDDGKLRIIMHGSHLPYSPPEDH